MNSVDIYIKGFPADVQEILNKIRDIIHRCAPAVAEEFAYGMPAYKTNGKPLVYYAAFNKHIGFYATPTGHSRFTIELSKYKQGKGSVQFPLNQPIPYNLIEKIVVFRINENALKGK